MSAEDVNNAASASADGDVILRVENLSVEFSNRRGTGRAVDGISFLLRRGETLGLVGESGSGKSVTSLAVVGLLPQPMAKIVGGHVWLDGEDLVGKSQNQMRKVRGGRLSMVLQDPMTALNPVFSIGDQIGESVALHLRLTGQALRRRIVDMLKLVRIPGAEQRIASYPHQFSGGMRQRVVSAIALAGEPEVLIADEPTTALDVTIQAAYLDVLRAIQRERNLAVLFITHDFGVVGEVCDRIAVMYSGRIVETGPTKELFAGAAHPYTKALLQSVPDVRQGAARLSSIEGAPPSIYDPPSGCRFHGRCWLYELKGRPEECVTQEPAHRDLGPDRSAACHFADEAMETDVPPVPHRRLDLALSGGPERADVSR